MIETLKNIMIVDDEVIQRNGLERMIQTVAPNTEIIACGNGKIALENARRNPPQLIITDIKMPVMDGMELIRHLADELPQVKIVLISAYQEFEFAKAAIRYKAIDYLIKPYRQEELNILLERIDKLVASESEREQQLAEFRQYSSEMEKQVEETRLRNLLFGQTTEEDLLEYAEFSAVFSLRFRCKQLGGGQQKEITERQKSLILSRILLCFPQSKLLPIAVPMQIDSEKVIAFVHIQDNVQAQLQLQKLKRQLQQDNILLWAGVSHIKLRIAEQSKEALAQAEDMLAFGFYHEQGSIYIFEQHESLLHTPPIQTALFEKEIAQAWRNMDSVAVQESLRLYQTQLLTGPEIYPRKVKHRISSMVMNLLKEIQGLTSNEEYDRLLHEAYMGYGACESIEELFAITGQLLANTNGFFQFNEDKYDAVEASIQYIKSHVEEDLSLQKVAKQMHFHPNYLSGQIKNKLGMSYTNFLVQLRMELAGELLRQTDLKIQDVARKCGFKDSSYFNRVFRKEHNLSPEQYRKVHKKW